MPKLAICAAVALAAGAMLGAAPAPKPLTPEQIFAKVQGSIWVVRVRDASGSGALGSAVEIGPRLLVSACHVVQGATSVDVVRESGMRIVPIATITRDPDHDRDLCLLTAKEDLGGAAAEIAPIAEVKVGEAAYAIGAPLGLELSLTDGLVSSLRHLNGEPLPDIQTSAAIAPGSSGGGLFDDQGRLIGVTVAIASKETDNLAFAYPAEWVAELPARIDKARKDWAAALKANGVLLGADGEPPPSGFAKVDDINAVPTDGRPAKSVANAYREFLLLDTPRAFVITNDGRAGAVRDVAELNSLFKECATRNVTCRLYAVDDAVVWKQDKPPVLKLGDRGSLATLPAR
ncbi:MAG TPA: serine protease [Caulobacteraceae bacterium]|nr:serine protease [Caulobacteraceae bacterium]